MDRTIERAKVALVWRLPRWLIYWAVIRAAVKDESGNPGEITAEMMLRRWGVEGTT